MTLPQQAETKRVTVYMPKPLWRALRQAAVDFETNVSQVCADAVEAHIAKLTKQSQRKDKSNAA